MRDPAVLALHALHLTPGEAADVLAGQPIRRRFWPPQHCQGGVVVGLCAGGEVLGEARLERVEPDRDAGGVVPAAVDAQAGGQALGGHGALPLCLGEVSLRGQREDVAAEADVHAPMLEAIRPSLQTAQDSGL